MKLCLIHCGQSGVEISVSCNWQGR